ncbi:primosomal protein DnaI [Lacticaseibacillus parakribbianus]|uniref:primosomal protein DnaI n=1 Tax=Lacticaseibacillus parakribbianus TaxID=2970927 RepID=UPI0021CB62B5|nr:primosomal protein DnaI [Lacticaseibacillus parakribbianus]
MKTMKDELAQVMDKRRLNQAYTTMMQAAVADEAVQAFLQQNADALAPDAVNRGAAKIYEYVNARDGKVTTPMQQAGYTPKLVVSNRLIDITYEPTPAKRAQEAQASQKALVTSLNMPKAIAAARLADYDPTNRGDALVQALTFTTELAKAPRAFHKGLYLTGPFGVGKTYLMGAMANDLAKQGLASTLVHWPTFAVEMKAAIGDQTVLPKLDAIKKAPVLMIDDIGAESLSPWIRDDVLGILLQYRMQEELPTLFTSNKTMAELTDFLAGVEVGNNEGLKAQRIMERIRFLATEVAVGGRDRRNG